MDTLNELPPVDQFMLLKQFLGTDKQPYTGVPAPVMVFRKRKPLPSVTDALPIDEAMFEMPVHRIDFRADDRVRFTEQGADVKTEPRTCRPWLQAHPAAFGRASGACIVRLTSEGRRRLWLLNDLIETQQQPPASIRMLMDSLS
jgi:hypothetical protein